MELLKKYATVFDLELLNNFCQVIIVINRIEWHLHLSRPEDVIHDCSIHHCLPSVYPCPCMQ